MGKNGFHLWFVGAVAVWLSLLSSCGTDSSDEKRNSGEVEGSASQSSRVADRCELVQNGFGSNGSTALRVEKIVTGLTVPWSLAFLSSNEFLVSERPGRIRLVRNGVLVPEPVLTLSNVLEANEGGLLGLAAHPNARQNGWVFVYYTVNKNGRAVNRVERYRLSPGHTTAIFERLLIDDIPAGQFHDGGRLKFGPDGNLYIGTGDARNPSLSQDLQSNAGKVLRIDIEGNPPKDNPAPESPVFISGVRNVQAFDWIDSSILAIGDHGPSGELGRTGHDELTLAKAGANLGWPSTWQCDQGAGVTRPILVWEQAAPPGGLAYYSGAAIPEWIGSVLIATLRSEHLHRVALEQINGEWVMTTHEVYLRNQYGRLRDVAQAPDGSLYVTTSNCDGRGTCGPERDMILRITKAQ